MGSIVRKKIPMSDFPPPTPRWWLARLPAVFSDLAADIAPGMDVKGGEGDYRRIDGPGPEIPVTPDARMFLRWWLPVHHAWPCDPAKTARFVEKAANAVVRKFGAHRPKALLAGAFQPMARGGYFRKLASNLRGRAIQVMPEADARPDSLAPDDPVVFIMVGRTGLFCGLRTPCQANGFHPGGTRFIRQAGGGVPSRAGAKIAEALHHMRLLMEPPPPGSHWLELGASPGGMTAELTRHGHRVTAIDRAPLHPSLDDNDRVEFIRADVARWKPGATRRHDALLCDMNGPAAASFAEVVRLSDCLRPGAPVIFTLKTAGADDFAKITDSHRLVLATAARAGLRHLQTTHLTYNRREFTVFFSR